MSTFTMPPLGAKIRVTTQYAIDTAVTVEGIVTGHGESSAQVPYVHVGLKRLVAYLQDYDGGAVTVEVLREALPEPADFEFVHIAPNPDPLSHTAAQRIGASGSRSENWFVIGNERPKTWAEICALGVVTPMRPAPALAASAPDLPWSYTDHADDRIVLRRHTEMKPLAVIEINDGSHGDSAHLSKAAAVDMAHALLRWAAGQP